MRTAAGTYSADIFGNGGCKGAAGNSSVVSIGTTPSGSITPSSGALCGSTPFLLTVGGGTTYQWYKDAIAIRGATNATYSVTAPGTYTADIISGTCTGKATNSAVITQGVIPSGTITPSTASICPGSSQTLTATGGTSYQWLKDGDI